MSERGRLIVLSGPSGAGKSTVISKVMQSRDDLAFSVSATTRTPRDGEVDGVNYYFISRQGFEGMIERCELLEHAEYVGNLYGTPRGPVEESLDSGISIILDIEVQGALQVKRRMPEAITIFLVPPSFDELERRLRGRQSESEEKILRRIETARREYAVAGQYDYIVVNGDPYTAANELNSIITAEKCKTANRTKFIEV
jgi:guanylate kinase